MVISGGQVAAGYDGYIAVVSDIKIVVDHFGDGTGRKQLHGTGDRADPGSGLHQALHPGNTGGRGEKILPMAAS